MKMSTYRPSYRIDHHMGYQGSRPSVRGQAEVKKYTTGHHYSEVISSGWPRTKGTELAIITPYTTIVVALVQLIPEP